MTDSFIHIKGIKNDCARDDREPNFYSHKFFCRHENDDQLRHAANGAINDMFKMGGMIVVRDESKPSDDHANLFFVPMHMLARIEFEIKQVTGQYIEDVAGATKQ